MFRSGLEQVENAGEGQVRELGHPSVHLGLDLPASVHHAHPSVLAWSVRRARYVVAILGDIGRSLELTLEKG